MTFYSPGSEYFSAFSSRPPSRMAYDSLTLEPSRYRRSPSPLLSLSSYSYETTPPSASYGPPRDDAYYSREPSYGSTLYAREHYRPLPPLNYGDAYVSSPALSSGSSSGQMSPREPSWEPPPSRKEDTNPRKHAYSPRSKISPYQRARLERAFSGCMYPSKDEQQQLAADLNLPFRTVQIWYNNRRQKGY